MQWGKKWPVQMNLPFFAVEAYVPGGVQNQAEKNSKKCLLAGTGTKFYFSSPTVSIQLLLTVPNGFCQTVFFRFLTSACDKGKPFHRDKGCLKMPLFSSILMPSSPADPDRHLNTPL